MRVELFYAVRYVFGSNNNNANQSILVAHQLLEYFNYSYSKVSLGEGVIRVS